MAAAQEYYVWVVLRGSHLSFFYKFSSYVFLKKSIFLRFLLRCSTHENILAGFFDITQLKIIADEIRKLEKTRLNELYIYVDKIFFLNEYFDSYICKT